MNKVGIILINYKDYADKFLDECAKSLRLMNFPAGEVSFIVVDNLGDESTEKTIKNLFPECVYVQSEKNGFGVGNNIGIAKAKELNCDFYYLLNMDTEVDPNFLTDAIDIYKSDKKAGLVQSRLMLHPEKDKINSIGNCMHYLGFGYSNGGFIKEFKSKKSSFEIAYSSGAGLLISKEMHQVIGDFTEEFFMYHDDMEWGMKSRLYGYKNLLACNSVVYHKYEFGRSKQNFYWMERNRIILWLMTLRIGTLILIAPMFFLMEFGMLFFSLMNGWNKEKLKSYKWFFEKGNWSKVKQWRLEVQRKRIISDRKLSKWFVSEINFQEKAVSNPLLQYFGNPLMAIYWYVIKLFIIW